MSIDELVGKSPAELRALYGSGQPADPSALGSAPKGRLLALESPERVHRLVRPALELVSKRLLPWKGKSFDLGGGTGRNRVFGFEAVGFVSERGASELDGAPTLFLRYDDPSLRNPWPLNCIVDELRAVEEGVAVGPASLRVMGKSVLLFWWGLEGGGGFSERQEWP